MKRNMVAATMLLVLSSMPLLAWSQAYRCPDGKGGVLYTDEPCAAGYTVVPEPSAKELHEQIRRADAAREQRLQAREQTLAREQDRLQAERDAAARQTVVPAQLATSAACRRAREEASFRAAVTRDTEQIRTARANAALACGQPLPSEPVVVVQPAVPIWDWRRPHRPNEFWPRPHVRPHPHPQFNPHWSHGTRSAPDAGRRHYKPGTEPLPMN